MWQDYLKMKNYTNLKTEDVGKYMRAQRAHQNNVELMSVFMPIFLIIGLYTPKLIFWSSSSNSLSFNIFFTPFIVNP